LAKTAGAPVVEARGAARPAGSVMASESDVEVLVSLIGLVDGDKEAERVEREIKKTDKDIAAIEKKLALPSFADKAPKEVVEESKLQLEAMKRKRAALEDARGIAGELGSKKG
jgi:valyl-tRNA synthetase